MLYLLVFFFSIYFVYLLYMLVPSFKSEEGKVESQFLSRISVIIPFKNEAKNLPGLIKSIQEINTSSIEVEFIFVNDHSSDKSVEILSRYEEFTLINSEGEGKKSAINRGVLSAQNEWILTIDADVQLPKSTLDELSVLSLDETKMLILPIRPKRQAGPVAAFFDLEFIALQGVGLGMADKGMPLMANGACLLFEREAFLQVNEERNDYQIASGDDIFSMFAIAKAFGYDFIKAGLSLTPVMAGFPNGFKQFFRQRSRWISKTTDVADSRYKTIAYSMAIVHVLPLMILGIFLFGIISLPVFLGLLAIKWGGEWIFFWHLTRDFERRDLVFYIPIAQLFYPFYIFALIASGLNYRLRNHKPSWDAT